ncbi:MAG: F0F1 ATP synthase subunit B [Chloroflexi bacterium]|nr:F0F1 ATP synthase subunit B [Chloroflexota bacterium]
MDALGIDLPRLLTFLVGFTVIAIFLRMFLYGPITRMLDQRADRIRDSLEAADRASAEAASSAERVEQELANARREGQSLIVEARDAASRLRDQEVERTRAQVEEMLDRAREEIRREREAAVEEVRREFAGIAILAAERIVDQNQEQK